MRRSGEHLRWAYRPKAYVPPTAMTNAADKIIVALDVPTKEKALGLVKQLRDQISFFKIGLQLYTAEGPEIVRTVLATGAKVWLDIKLHDIPNTVGRAVRSEERRVGNDGEDGA